MGLMKGFLKNSVFPLGMKALEGLKDGNAIWGCAPQNDFSSQCAKRLIGTKMGTHVPARKLLVQDSI